MSKNCLVTRLNGIVDNDNIPVLGEMRIFTLEGSSTNSDVYIQVGMTEDGTLHAYKGKFTRWNSPTELEDDTVSASSIRVIKGIPSEETIIGIKSKYNTNFIGMGNYVCINDIADLRWMAQGAEISIVKGANPIFGSGNIDALSELPDGAIKISKLPSGSGVQRFSLKNVSGSLVNLEKFELMSDMALWLDSATITGNFSVFASMSNAWKTYLKQIHTDSSNKGIIGGNINVFSEYNFSNIYLNNIYINGSIAVGFGNCTDLTQISMNLHKDAEDLASWLDTLHTNGKVSGTLNLYNMGTNKTITYNGSSHPFVNDTDIVFDANGWSVSA
jgi:hypothetical protein